MIVLREVAGDGSDFEIRYIRVSRRLGIRLVNSTNGGDGVTMTPEIRGKIGDKNRGKPNSMKGKSRSPEFCASISASKIGHEVSLETRKKISDTKKSQELKCSPERCAAMSFRMSGEKHPMFGKHHSEETKTLQSAAKLGRPATESQLANLSLGRKLGRNKGVPRTPETRLKISNSLTGVPKTEEQKAKISKTLTGRPHSLERSDNISAGRKAGIARRKQRDQEIEWALAPYTLE